MKEVKHYYKMYKCNCGNEFRDRYEALSCEGKDRCIHDGSHHLTIGADLTCLVLRDRCDLCGRIVEEINYAIITQEQRQRIWDKL